MESDLSAVITWVESHYGWFSGIFVSLFGVFSWLSRLWWRDRVDRLKRLRAVEEAAIEFARQTAAKERECAQHRDTLNKIERDIHDLSITIGQTREDVMFIKGKMEKD